MRERKQCSSGHFCLYRAGGSRSHLKELVLLQLAVQDSPEGSVKGRLRVRRGKRGEWREYQHTSMQEGIHLKGGEVSRQGHGAAEHPENSL